MVINTGSVGEVVWSSVDFWSSDGTFVIKTSDNINDKFLYYFLKTQESYLKTQKREGGVPTIDRQTVENLSIPIPPLAIQNEIVKILDLFTRLEAELEAELEARKMQYTYYRDALLNFEGKGVEWKTLGEVVFYPKDRLSAKLVNETNYVGVDNLLQDRRGKIMSNYVPTTGNLIEFKENDILVGNIRPYLKKIWFSDLNGGTNGDVLVFRLYNSYVKSYYPKFLYYVLASDHFFDYNMQFAKGAKMPRGDKNNILKYPIPVPPLSEQERIVGILDKFDALVNDLSSGLPAEIKARRQQYEYYRDQLLTFKNRDHG